MANEAQTAVSIFPNLKKTDALMGIGVIAILAIMIIPLPPTFLDILLATNVTLALVIILISMYILNPLDFSLFPSLLLVTTLYRLSLNVASTRLILLHGNEGVAAAGHVIKSFGMFLIGGNYFVGLVIFLILSVINFVVITKGSGRIAEVAARFTLDSMPGKQMSIDADLNSGLITEKEAIQRREQINKEADFYGAMDGASKFVRGEAIAGLVIMGINILGGLLIGITQKNMSLADAARSYTILTIGDGLVSQIPALIVSTAAGLVVTRAASDETLGDDVTKQIISYPKAVAIAGIILFSFGLIPGLPHLPFFILGIAGVIASQYFVSLEKSEEQEVEDEAPAEKSFEETFESLLSPDMLGLEVGYGIIPFIDTSQNGELLQRIKSIRRQMAIELGIMIPPIHVKDNLNFKPGEYAILLKGIEIARGNMMLGHSLALAAETTKGEIEGIPTKDPTFNLPALWIPDSDKERAQILGYTVVDIPSVIATHLTETIKNYSHELIGRQEVQKLIDGISKTHPKLVEELIPNNLTLGGVQKVLQNLLKEQIPIKDLITILECLADYSPLTKDTDVLTEYVRQGLSRYISHRYRDENNEMKVAVLDTYVEETISNAIQNTSQGSYLALDPEFTQSFLEKISMAVQKFNTLNLQPIILCSPIIRFHLKRLTEKFIPNLAVISHNELTPDTKINTIEIVSM
ncbi:MAG: flagellar biosynthesis protein FlhA [Candidatus Schekmanbacteria bacterium]|nr:MAG: flagellar biosynthesis protein FlhA [Candidatus Schekmanbacteria bacterium]